MKWDYIKVVNSKIFAIFREDKSLVCKCVKGNETRLIAAAPEMLDALIELIECDYTSGTHLSSAIINAKSVVKKATGEDVKALFEINKIK